MRIGDFGLRIVEAEGIAHKAKSIGVGSGNGEVGIIKFGVVEWWSLEFWSTGVKENAEK